MSRYIDADAMESTLQDMEMITAMSHIELGEEDDDVGEISLPMLTVRKIMKTVPSIDIVRCKECRYYVPWDDTCGGCEYLSNSDYLIGVGDGFFCADGERSDT